MSRRGLLQIVYGAGTKGRMLVRMLSRGSGAGAVHCLLDADPARWGQQLDAVPVRSPDYLRSLERGSFHVHVAVGRGYAEVQHYLEGLGLRQPDDFAPAALAPAGLEELDAGYRQLRLRLAGHTLLSDDRLQVLHQLAGAVRRIPGSVAEVGVHRGGSALLLAEVFAATDKQLHLFDTFTGMPEQTEACDLHCAGDFADTSLAAVRQLLADYAGVQLHPGTFPATVTTELAAARFCFVHIDADIQRSVADCCAFFQPRLEPGGMLLFDDYGFPTCPGVRRAVDGYFRDRPERPIYLPTGQALIIAPPAGAAHSSTR